MTMNITRKLNYIELSEKPEPIIDHEDFKYRLSAFTTKIAHLASSKLNDLLKSEYEAICVKYEERFYIYVKVRGSLQVSEGELPEPVSGRDTEISESGGEE